MVITTSLGVKHERVSAIRITLILPELLVFGFAGTGQAVYQYRRSAKIWDADDSFPTTFAP